jgi:hypothetical protein
MAIIIKTQKISLLCSKFKLVLKKGFWKFQARKMFFRPAGGQKMSSKDPFFRINLNFENNKLIFCSKLESLFLVAITPGTQKKPTVLV